MTRYLEERPDKAEVFWSGHPRVAFALSMAEIGQAAAQDERVNPRALASLVSATRGAPLAVEPFLIEGALATAQSRPEVAELLFLEARRRDPRSPAARYFLARRYLSTNRTYEGLAEAAQLTRLVSQTSESLIPALAEYAQQPGATSKIGRVFEAYPELRDPVLARIVREPEDADLVISLAGDTARSGSSTWRDELLRGLVEQGQFGRAYALWQKMGPGKSVPGLFNPGFATSSAPPPFNWTLQSGDFGVAAPIQPDGLQVIYYGRTNAEFARQLMLLSPGRYELSMDVSRQAEARDRGGLAWTFSCGPEPRQLVHIPLVARSGAKTRLSAKFSVPPGCVSQSLRLHGTPQDPVSSEQVVITKLQLLPRAH